MKHKKPLDSHPVARSRTTTRPRFYARCFAVLRSVHRRTYKSVNPVGSTTNPHSMTGTPHHRPPNHAQSSPEVTKMLPKVISKLATAIHRRFLDEFWLPNARIPS
jgi:hypothetical protein